MSRKEIRNKILGNTKPLVERLNVFGTEIEIRQPTLRDIISARSEENNQDATTGMIIKYCYDPESGERIFEDADREVLLDLPFGQDFLNISQALNRLTGLNFEDAEGNSKASLSSEQPST